MKTVLFVHQSAEMYGSDKVLLSLAAGLNRVEFNPVVLLPCGGPLREELDKAGVMTHVVPLVKVSRATFSPLGLLRLPLDIIRSMRAITAALAGEKVDVVHSNTLAVLSGALWAKWKGITHIWHVHEMIVHPSSVKRLFPMLLRLLADKVACNSGATMRLLLSSQPSLSAKSLVIWNGIERKEPVSPEPALRKRLGLGSDKILVVLAGRINRWKGQGLLVEAAEILQGRGVSNAHFLIIGSYPPGQEHFLGSLERKIAASSAKDDITVMDFTDDIWEVWDSCDIAAVPSTEPEPFGMVALEAMVSGKPVIAAAHGGLTDIIVDGFTGSLFEPSNAAALADCLEMLVKDGEKRSAFGQNGRRRAFESFSLGRYVSSFSELYRNA